MLEHLLFGKLTLEAIPYHNPIIMGASAFMGLCVIAVIGALFYFRKWTYLWKEWLTSVDHKKIGIMYLILAAVMLLRGFSDAIMMRMQQALSVGHSYGFLPADHFNEVFTAHGVIMIFFMAMAFVFGLANILIPLQIGARDVAYPYLNSLSFWLTAAGAILINLSLFIGKFAATGWLAYPPLSELAYSPGVGVDYYLWALTLSGAGTLIGAINIFVTIIKMRCPGMTLMKMPMFTWSTLCAMILVIVAFPVLNITLGMLFFDRFFGTHIFTSGFGGNMMLYVSLIWTWGHPEVYILVLPVFGIYSEVVATFSRKKLFGYAAMVYATACITVLSFTVWLHHFFTMGSGANVNSFFGIATMIISIPTGVKLFNWIATMYRGKIEFTLPMMYTMAFMVTFSIGGMTGVLMSVPGVDFQMHNSVFLIAHFHNTIIGGVVFGLFAGIYYWAPKIFGFKLHEGLGKIGFWCWVVGFYIAFMPLYALGFMGMTRRLEHYPAATGWHPFLVFAAVGAVIIMIGIASQVISIFVSIKNREKLKDTTGDPWNGRTLEWSMSSPPPFYNFAHTPTVDSIDPFWEQKQKNGHNRTESKKYNNIHMPKNTSIGFLIGICGGIFGFAMIWDMTLLSIISGISILGLVLARTFDFDTDYYVQAEDVQVIEESYIRGLNNE